MLKDESTPERGEGQKRRYTSPAMRARRKRIVDEAHNILAEDGVAAFTIKRLSERAEVAHRTIYRLFGDKDGVIFASVADRMREVREHLAAKGRDYTLETVYDELDWMVSEMERDTGYARLIIGFYFSMEPKLPAIHEMRSVAFNRFFRWMEREEKAGNVREDVEGQIVAQQHVGNEWIVYRRWALEVIDSEQCRLELRACFLQSASVLLKAAPREKIMGLLAPIHAEIMRLRSTREPQPI